MRLKKWISGLLLLSLSSLFLFLLSAQAFGNDHYSYEHSEELKLLIHWRDYTPGAFQEAIEQNKPIFLLLTAPTWCYWCQVYESEEYLFHPSVVSRINAKFIPIYVDADKRQDLTRTYLEGGWPSTTILSPNRERLYGFSGPRPVENMVVNLDNAAKYVNSRGFSNQIKYDYDKTPTVIPTTDQLIGLINGYAAHILQVYDSVNGGFGTGQKFPQGLTLDFSLELYEETGDSKWIGLVKNTLQNQHTKTREIKTNYNIFDPVEGGFHRYGTQADWSPPHYEKMLYDNARLLKVYSHLLELEPDNEVAKEVVSKTLTFIEKNWYAEDGGFYGNSDVHGEDEYYGQINRPEIKPRVEKTRYSDWNSDAILTYLYLWEVTNDEKFKNMAAKSLDFFAKEMVSENGSYHYFDDNSKKGVRGNLLDNAPLFLVFVEGYEVLGESTYLDTAKTLAKYSMDNLYDWYSAGFFERNSPDFDLYAPQETIVLSKPMQENGIMAFALIKLYNITKEEVYLNAGIKTLGSKLDQVAGLDRGYYYIKTAQYIVENNLLTELKANTEIIEMMEQEQQKSFWVSALIQDESKNQPKVFVSSDEGIEKLHSPILILLPVALLAGIISFASPCTLPILPAYIAYSIRYTKLSIKGMTISFFAGLSIVFSGLGMSATIIGSLIKTNLTIFSQAAGIGIMAFGIFVLLGKGFKGINVKHNNPKSYLESFLFGGALGLSWTPCVGPILVALLLLASTAESAYIGGILLFVYGTGLGLPLMIISTRLNKINKEGKLWKIIQGKDLKFGNKMIHSNTLISGLLFIIVGYLVFSGLIFAFNQYVAATSFQKWLFMAEEWILNLVR